MMFAMFQDAVSHLIPSQALYYLANVACLLRLTYMKKFTIRHLCSLPGSGLRYDYNRACLHY